MGAWGVGLYQDDVTSDVRDDYLDWLRVGKTSEEALKIVLDRASGYLDDEDDEPLFWFALADTQWKYGRLDPDVKKMALKHLQSGKSLERWKEANSKLYEKRKKVLKQLEEKLKSPQPELKKVTKIRVKKPIWDVGDVLLYKVRDNVIPEGSKEKYGKWYGKYVLCRVMGVGVYRQGSLPDEYSNRHNIIGIYNWVGDTEPTVDRIKELDFDYVLKGSFFDDKELEAVVNKFVASFSKKELKVLNFNVIMKDPDYVCPENDLQKYGGSWPNVYNLEYDFVKALDYLENSGKLVDDRKQS